MTTKNCDNCGAVMLWNYEKERWDCLLCGNSIEENFKSKYNGYIQ
jgi:ribosomal protein S27AE